jgi:predicted nucleic acid-binding Zn ribbon protein
MKEELSCKFCNKKLERLWWDAWKCEYCGEIFCSTHVHWENHECKKLPQEIVKKETKRVEKQLKLIKSRTYWIMLIFGAVGILFLLGVGLFTPEGLGMLFGFFIGVIIIRNLLLKQAKKLKRTRT